MIQNVINSSPIPKNMRLIPAGEFSMGSNEWGEFEKPIHSVFINDFFIDVTPVTNEDFSRFIKETGYITTAEKKGYARGYHKGVVQVINGLCWRSYATSERLQHPVILISWYDAFTYAQWTGKRLPTEAEFEKAARGGIENALYPWGDNEPSTKDCNFNKVSYDIPSTTQVGSFPPNNYELHDICGNVWNWCNDWFSESYYQGNNYINPLGPENGNTKVRRGASFNIAQPFRLRCANRGAYHPEDYSINIGFRCVKSL